MSEFEMPRPQESEPMDHVADDTLLGLSRRSLLRGSFAAAVAGTTLLLAACGESSPDEQPATSNPETSGQGTQGNEEPTPQDSPSPEAHKGREYPQHTKIMATVFYLGEEASKANAGISNIPTAWDENSVARFGGVDDPSKRSKDGGPADFQPKHNPYYFALPADEFDENGPIKGAHETSPWADEPVGEERSLFKGRWIEVERDGASVYAQWVDCGPSDNPNGARDYSYVFGADDARPKNTFGLKAGLDLSPAAADALGFGVEEGGAKVSWRFVDPVDVPDGPWKDYPPINNHTYWS